VLLQLFLAGGQAHLGFAMDPRSFFFPAHLRFAMDRSSVV
jgi:hypothetical protein